MIQVFSLLLIFDLFIIVIISLIKMESDFQAHHIALKILKQRCEYLQQRVESIEEENCQLKLQKLGQAIDENAEHSYDNIYLQEQITLLNKENGHLSHQVQMVTTENQTLWTLLSKLMSENDTIGEKLSISTLPISSQRFKSDQVANSLQLDSSKKLSGESNEESLEDISLKLLNGILMGKAELENQYSQMIDLQKENEIPDMKNIPFLSSYYDNRVVMKNMQTYLKKLKDFKQALSQQKNELTSAITNVKNFNKVLVCTNCDHNLLNCDKGNGNDKMSVSRSTHLPSQDNGVKGNEDNLNANMICPLCGKIYKGDFANFYQHVSNHFSDEDEEFVDASSNFDAIP